MHLRPPFREDQSNTIRLIRFLTGDTKLGGLYCSTIAAKKGTILDLKGTIKE